MPRRRRKKPLLRAVRNQLERYLPEGIYSSVRRAWRKASGRASKQSRAAANTRLTAPKLSILSARALDPSTDDIPHLVITRLMIGCSRPSAFRLHAAVLLETLYPSLVCQTFKNFSWVIVTDEHIDASVLKDLRRVFAGHPNFHIELLDPFVNFSTAIDVAALCRKYLNTTRNVITTRIDDDDALRYDFLERVQKCVKDSGSSLVSISFQRGISTASEVMAHSTKLSKAGASAGMSLYSPDVAKFNVHSTGHSRVHAKVETRGGKAYHLESDEPYYLSGEHGTSNSREKRNERRAAARFAEKYNRSTPSDQHYVAVLASFGLTPDFDGRIKKIRETMVDPAPALLLREIGTYHLSSRMTFKDCYLRWAKEIACQQLSGEVNEVDRRDLQLHLLKQAYYSL